MHILFVNDAIKTRKISRQKINDFHVMMLMIFGIVMLSVGAFMKSFISQTRKIKERKDSQ